MLLVITTAMVTSMCIIIYYLYRNNLKKNIQSELVEIPTINEDDVINSKIESMIHSIANDDGWLPDVSSISNKIRYSKKLERKVSSGNREVSLTVNFEFDKKEFKIKSISINSNSGSLSYTGKLDLEKIKIFYNTYSEYRKTENDDKLKKINNILTDVNEAIDKSTSRDFKINEILK